MRLCNNQFVIFLFLISLSSCGKSIYSEKVIRYYDEKVKGEDTSPETTSDDTFALENGSSPIHAPKGWQVTPIHIKVEESFNDQHIETLEHVIGTFNQIVGWDLLTYHGQRIAPRKDSTTLYEMQDVDGLRLYNRANWEGTGKWPFVLATTVWNTATDDKQIISTAEIHFNTNLYLFVDALQVDPADAGTKEFVDFETLLLHEMGHALGLDHQSASRDRNSLMSPTVFIGPGLTNRSFSEMDIANIQSIYKKQ